MMVASAAARRTPVTAFDSPLRLADGLVGSPSDAILLGSAQIAALLGGGNGRMSSAGPEALTGTETPSAAGSGSIIPSPGTPGIAANTSSTLVGLASIPSGTTYFGDGIATAHYGQYDTFYPGDGSILVRSVFGQVVNDGTLWHRVTSANTDDDYDNIAVAAGSLLNRGTIVGQMDNGRIFGAWSSYTVSNEASGRIYALTGQGEAIALAVKPHPLTHVTNSGLIAAQATGVDGVAVGIETGDGTSIVNGSTGSILAEAPIAIAIYYYSGSTYAGATVPNILNEGLIRAQSLDFNSPSIGIQLQHLPSEPMKVVNRGTIIADLAIYTDSYLYSPPQKSVEEIVNEAGGRIKGVIFLDLGDDIVVNSGTIEGVVLLDQGADRFDNTLGVLDGYADMGGGNDLFLGSAGTDAVYGGRDDDRIEGGGGEDILFGGFGNDTLIGGDGNDGLFGESGNDVITTKGSDFVWGGIGDDRIELGDYTFEQVDGGQGFDTLVLPGGARILDLSLVLAADALYGIEAIEMRGSQELVVRAADVAALAGGLPLRLTAQATDRIDLVGAWTEGSAQTIGGVAYRSFASGGSSVLVSGGATVSLGATPPAGATGLDPLTGPLAPLPGDIPGIELTSDTTVVYGPYGYFLHMDSLAIGPEETWISENGRPVLAVGLSLSITIQNEGTIRSETTDSEPAAVYAIGYLQGGMIRRGFTEGWDDGKGAEALAIDNVDYTVNSGTITAATVGEGTAVAYFGLAHGTVRNSGVIEAVAENGWAFGVALADGGNGPNDAGVLNSGRIAATSAGSAVAVQFINASYVVNHGTIEAVGGERAIAIDCVQLVLANDGQIIARTTAAGGASYGLYIYPHVTASLENSGLIRADVAVYGRGDPADPNGQFLDLYFTNTGTVEGRLELSAGFERIWNTGTMTGQILFGDGNDLYDGRGGTQSGGVYGEGGDDVLIGGAGPEVFAGGPGGDVLDGGGGADRFLYLAAGDSTAGAMDRIRGFQSGIDKIDLSALGVVASIGWTQQTDPSDGSSYFLVQVQSADGAMTIRVAGDGLAMSDFIRLDPPQTITGTSSDDVLAGGSGADTFFLQQGGNDNVSGGDGNDGFFFGAAFTAADHVDGGAGNNDQIGLQGDHTGANKLTLGANTISGVEVIAVLPGFSYDITTVEANVAAGQVLKIQATQLAAGQSLTFNGSAEHDGSFIVYGGNGNDSMTGGAGNDGFYFGPGGYSSADIINGGPGANDQLALDGDYTLTLGSNAANVEVLVLLPGPAGTPNHFDITSGNAFVGAGQTMIVFGLQVGTGIHFNGSGELDGAFRIYGGTAGDTIIGSHGNDWIFGGNGDDGLVGGAGNDTYYYDDTVQSTVGRNDIIFDFATGDKVDVSGIDAIAGGANDAFTFLGSGAFTNHAGELRAADQGGGSWLVEADTNGDGVADLQLILLVSDAHPITSADFTL